MKKIAFYAPLKPVGHPVPSGDRLMAQQLITLLQQLGYQVDIASNQRAFLRDSGDQAAAHELQAHCEQEVQRLRADWQAHGAPDAWFCYHPYFKSPDLIGPPLCKAFAVPYLTAEAAWSARRNKGVWRDMQARMLDAVQQAALNICFTQRDLLGLQQAAPQAHLARLKPFIHVSEFERQACRREPHHLVTVAMMRAGDKLHSYQHLAAALQSLLHLPWHLSIVGDGPLRQEIEQLFSAIPAERLRWQGRLTTSEIADLMARCGMYLWPGCGEAYGLAYLEAQAAGLPVVAYRTAGVPEVVEDGRSGILTEADDVQAYAQAVARLLGNEPLRASLSASAVDFVQQHSVEQARLTLGSLMQDHVFSCRKPEIRS